MARTEVRLEGGCLCGEVRYRILAHEGSVPLCHCDNCRRQSGAPAVAWLEVARADFTWLGDGPRYYRYRSELAARVQRGFCATCGSSLTWERAGAATLDVATGTLDDPAAAPPTHHCWAPRALDWIDRDDGLPRHDEGTAPYHDDTE